MTQNKEVVRNNILVTASSIFVAIVGFILSIVLARLLGPFGFGVYSFALTVVSFFYIFTTIGTGYTVIRFVAYYMSKKDMGKINSIIRTGFKYRIILTMIIGSLMIVFSYPLASHVFNKPDTYIIIILSGILLIIESITDFFYSIYTSFKDFGNLIIIRILDKVLKLLFTVSLVLLGFSYSGAVSGLIIAGFLVMIASAFLLKKYKHILTLQKADINKKIFFTFGLWAFVSSFGESMFNNVDSFMISVLLGIEDIGFYRIASMWSFALSTVFPISGLVLFPYLSSSKKTQAKTMFVNSLRYAFIIIIPMAFLLSAFSDSIILFFYTEDFTKSTVPLMILSLAVIPTIISSLLNIYFTGVEKPKIATKIITFSLLINIILNYVFIYYFDIMGAAVATLLSRILETGLLLMAAKKTQKLSIKANIIWKPLLTSLIIYYIAMHLAVPNIFFLVLYGVTCLIIYAVIMLAIKGIVPKEIKIIRELLKR